MALFFRERSSVWIVVAIFISLVGVALLAWGDAGHRDPARGLTFAGMTVVTYAVYIIGVMKSRTAMLDPLVVAFYVLTFSAAIFLVYALSTSGLGVVHTWPTWRSLLLLALLPTVLSNYTLVQAIRHIGPTMTSILGSMEPLTAVVIGLLILDRKALTMVDYGLLATFVCFFIFSGNMSRLPAVRTFFSELLEKNTLLTAVISCQFISNVPTAVLLAQFTDQYAALLRGVNIGGTGTLIASLASLITFREFTAHYRESTKMYLGLFTLMNFGFLLVLALLCLAIG